MGLSNVYSGQAPTRSSFVFTSIKPQVESPTKLGNLQSRRAACMDDQIGEDLPEENYESKAFNANDCIAESMNSCWD